MGGSGTTVEVFNPVTGQSCSLPSFSTDRYGHTSVGGELCGPHNYCSVLSSGGKWVSSHFLANNRPRGYHCSWTTGEGTILLGGGEYPTTTEIITEGTLDGMPGFTLEHELSAACSIPDMITNT